jgi:subtilisin
MLRRSLVALFALSLIPLTGATQAGGDVSLASGRYIVVLKGPASGAGVLNETVAAVGGTLEGIFGSVLNGGVLTLPLLNLDTLRSDPRVAYVAPDRPVRLLAEPAPAGVARIGSGPRLAADGTVSAGPEPKAAVAILDTGISAHPDLNVVGGVNCAEDPLGDLLGGLLGGGGGGGTDYADNHGHGTHVSGTVAARSDGQGVMGVSPGSPLYAVRVFSALGAGSLSGVICGLDWVAANAAEKNIKVVNMSLGGSGVDDGACGTKSNDPFHAAICRVVGAGVTVVVAAGNSNVNLVETVPAAYNEVLTVAAMADFDGLPGGLSTPSCSTKDQDDTAADFSNFAAGDDANHTVTAPGVCVNSTWKDGGYKAISGTSMASPHVAGLVARCIDAGPCSGLTPAQIIEKIRADAAARPADTGFFGDPNMPMESRYYGHLVNGSAY